MKNSRMAFVVVAACGAVVSSASALPCGSCTNGVHVSDAASWNLSITLNGWEVPSCPSSAVTYGVGQYAVLTTPLLPENERSCLTNWDDDSGLSLVDEVDSGDAANESVEAESEVFESDPGAIVSGSFRAQMSGCLGANVSTQSEHLLASDTIFGNAGDEGVTDSSGGTTGYAALVRNYVFVRTGLGDMSYTRTHEREMTVTIWSGDCGSPGSGPFTVSFSAVSFSIPGATGTAAGVHQGLLAVNHDGSIQTLGFYEGMDWTFVEDPFGGPSVFSGSQDFVADLTDEPEEMTETVESDTFEYPNGDVGRDGSVCWTDRFAMIAAMGTSIEELGYHPRADFDLNGDIDSADYAAYVTYFDSVACTADYDCSGVVDADDTFAFLDEWFLTTLKADFDGSGTTDADDIFVFLDAYFLGC